VLRELNRLDGGGRSERVERGERERRRWEMEDGQEGEGEKVVPPVRTRLGYR
jgi:hypothetical protein